MGESRSTVRVAAAAGFAAEADRLAAQLQLPRAPARARFELIVGSEGLALAPADPAGAGIRPLTVDLAAARPGSEDVVRAVRGRRGLHALGGVVDATAGLGVDAAALARAGLDVTMIERDPVMHALLRDALDRLTRSADPERRSLADRLRLLEGDAAHVLPHIAPAPDVVYLDPMYPAARGGAKRRSMAWLRDLLEISGEEGEDDRELLAAARRAAVRRVVLKRPVKAPLLAPGSSGSVRGRTTRFDLYAPLTAGGEPTANP